MSGDGEFAFIERLREALPDPPPGQTWIGDDCAVLADGSLVATDLLVEGVHFRSDWARPTDIGFKALAVNLSDIAAMGGTPESAVVAVALPQDRPGLADDLLAGLIECAEQFACPLVGGDTSAGPELFIAVTVTGRSMKPVLRSGAGPGETVFVTGPLGAAAATLALLEAGEPAPTAAALHRPLPRLDEGRVAASARATAMLDLSDGLAADLPRIARASGVGIEVDPDAIPVAEGATTAQAVGGGDDYELCFTAADPAAVRALFARAGLRTPVAIGTTTSGSDTLLGGEPLEGGWEHPLR
ncbi:MAG TPA: thiamine-phosphate kinase [Acidimicrobiales bacterium]